MKLVKPVTITGAMITACDVPETDYTEWNAATAYILADRCIRASTHKIYERLIAGTTATAPESDAVNWIEVSATNRWKMFDQSTGSQTSQTDSFSISLLPGVVVNNISLLNLAGASVNVTLNDPVDGEVFNLTKYAALGNTIGNWDDYFFDYITLADTIIFSDIPQYTAATITITVTHTGSTAACGVLSLGRAIELGGVQYGAKMGIIDYSRKEVDVWGGYALAQRAFSKRTTFDIQVPKEIVNQIMALLTEIRATPVVWIGSEEYFGTVVYGFYKDFEVTISYPTMSDCSLTIEGMT
jgi:hypothetical protein